MTCIGKADDRLVKTDWRFDCSLQFCVIDEIAGRQRLLDHEQVVLIELLENTLGPH